MSKNPPSRSCGVASPRFWRNVTLIALAHVALIAGLIRWSLAARSAPDTEALVWLSGAEDLAAERSGPSSAPPEKIPAPPVESGPLKPDETEQERPSLAQAKSEIDLPTPRPTPIATPVPKKITSAARTEPTPKSAPRPTPKKTVLVKASKPPTHAKSSLRKSNEEQTDSSKQEKKSAKTVTAKTKSSADNASGKTGSAGKAGGTSGGSSASEFGWWQSWQCFCIKGAICSA